MNAALRRVVQPAVRKFRIYPMYSATPEQWAELRLNRGGSDPDHLGVSFSRLDVILGFLEPEISRWVSSVSRASSATKIAGLVFVLREFSLILEYLNVIRSLYLSIPMEAS